MKWKSWMILLSNYRRKDEMVIAKPASESRVDVTCDLGLLT